MATPDLKSLLPGLPPENRREFLARKLAAGFALAVRPIGAQTITTDTKGLTAGEVQIPMADGKMVPAYYARPSRSGKFPTILVVQEIFGVHEHIKDLCRRLAKSGYMAVATEMFARQGDVSKIQNVQEIVDKVVSKVPDSQVMSDLDSTAAWAAKNGGSADRLAITGFCWGGRIVWLYAAHNPRLITGAAWYGRLEGDKNALTPQNPLDYAALLKAPVIGFYGGKDTGIPKESIERMRAVLSVVDTSSLIIVYPDAQHGFNADYRPSYNKDDAEDAWQKMLTWFKKAGV
jgi:carboxymethylenebutenolidase